MDDLLTVPNVLCLLMLIAAYVYSCKFGRIQGSTAPQQIQKASPTTRAERAAGALMGVLVGDALGMGMQWYYNLADKEAAFGPWCTDYTAPDPSRADGFGYISKFRHDQGLRAGDTTQMGQIFALLLDAAAVGGPDGHRAGFCDRLDALYATLSGEPLSGRYTDGIYRKSLKARRDGTAWGPGTATDETTGDGAVFAVALAALYEDPVEMVTAGVDLLGLLLKDSFIVQNSLVFGLSVQALINGVPLKQLGAHVKAFGSHPVLRPILGSFDNFLTPSYGAVALPAGFKCVACEEGVTVAEDAPGGPTVTVEPPKLVSLLFGLDCQLTHVLPAAYYLAHRFPGDFENAVLSASNGGGQNVVRAALTGALCGALVGVPGIPPRFLEGLVGGDTLLQQARRVAAGAKVGGDA